jgi:hypothetical protein
MSTNTHILEKIFVGSMKHYMKDMLNKFNTATHSEFLEYSKSLITFGRDDQILQLFYLEKFLPVLKYNKIIDTNTNEENLSRVTLDIEKNLLDYYITSKKNKSNIYQYLVNFGNFRKNIMDEMFNRYSTLEDEKLFLKVSNVFLLNNFSEKNWEEICLNRIRPEEVDIKGNSLNFKLLQHLKKYLKEKYISQTHDEIKNFNQNTISFLMSLPDFFSLSTKNLTEPNPTTTQEKLSKTLDTLNIQFSKEFSRDGYIYDYFLPELNIVLEYDGPDHFYPLQTQLKEKFKFRYRNITKNTNSKVVIIPYYEYLRCDTQDSFKAYLRKILFKDSDFSKGSLFVENYDMYKASIRPLM